MVTDTEFRVSLVSVPAEVWSLIAEQLQVCFQSPITGILLPNGRLQTTHRKTLEAFASTCRTLYKISQPLLHEQRILRLHKLKANPDLASKSLPPGMKQMKDFKVLLGRQKDDLINISRLRIHPYESDQLALFVSRMVTEMKSLREFESVVP